MRFRDQVALTVPAIILRVLLALIFIWAGLGKLMVTDAVTPEEAAMLASIGVPLTVAPSPATPPPSQRLPEPEGAQAPPTPAPTAPSEPASAPAETLPDPSGSSASAEPPLFRVVPVVMTQPTTTPPETTQTPADPPASPPAAAPAEPGSSDQPTPVLPPAGARIYSAADFPEGASVLRVYRLAQGIHHAAHPGLDENSQPIAPIWPEGLARGAWPKILAWAVALTELIAGALVLFGLLTRVSALSLASIMLGAIWLTEVGPALQSGKTMLGFLPDRDPFGMEWQSLMVQVSMLGAALALFLLGPGPVSLDRALFRGRRDDFYEPGPAYADEAPLPSRRPV